MSKNNVYQIITDEILKKLENVNVKDFEKPWFNIGLSPYNAISKKAYRGLNYITLGSNNYESKAYASFNQWKKKQCQVKKGEQSHIAVFWKIGKYEESETGEERTSFLLRFYRVFNSEQVEGDFAREVEQTALNKLKDIDPIKSAESVAENYITRERLHIKNSDHACYVSSLNGEHVEMPYIGQFKNAESYYSTLFHELGHSTGSEKRLNRDMSGSFGSKKYAFEELVAELCAAMVSGSIGMTQKPRIDHVQYIKSWIRVLKNDNTFIISAAAKAQKAADLIIGENEIFEEVEI